MADSKHGVRRTLSRIAVVVAVLASALVVLPAGVRPAAAAPTHDQGTAPGCSPTNYPEKRSGGTFQQSFTPGTNYLGIVHVCTESVSPAPVTVSVHTRDSVGAIRQISTGTNTPSTTYAASSLEVNVGDVVVTPGLTYVLTVTLPAGVSWRGTTAGGPDAYTPGAASEAAIGDFGFDTFGEDLSGLLNRRADFEAANTAVRLVEETFNTRPVGEVISSQIPGVAITTVGEAFSPQVFHDLETDNELFAVLGTGEPENAWNYTISPDEASRAVGFEITSLDPEAGPVQINIELFDGDVTTFETISMFDDDNDEETPFWFGYQDASRNINAVTITGPPGVGSEAYEEFAIDDVTFERDVPNAIAFDRSPYPEPQDIWVMDEDGGRQTQLTFSPYIDSDPSFTADGSRIAYACLGSTGRADICVMDSDGTDPRNLTAADLGAFDQYNADPAFSPDGTKIAFSSGTYGAGYEVFDVWVMNADGSGKVNLTGTEEAGGSGIREGFATFSPDGTQLAFHRGREDFAGADLFRMPATGGPATPITTLEGNEFFPSWSNAGIAYAAEPGGDTAIGLANPDIENDVEDLVDEFDINEHKPAWKPDASRVAYTREGFVYRRTIATGSDVRLSDGPNDDNPTWSAAEEDEITTASLVADRATAKAAVERVDLAQIPAEYLALIASGQQAARLGSAPAGSIPAGSIPAGSIPAGSIPAGSIPAGSIDLEASPAGSIPVYSLFLNSLPAGSIPAGSIPAGSIPAGSIPAGSIGLNGTLLSALGLSQAQLDALLADTELAFLPAQTITLAQVLAHPVVKLRFLELDLATSGLAKTLFGSVGMAALLLGAHPINTVPVPASASTDPNPTWCGLLLQQTGVSCQSLGIDPTRHSFLGAQLAGAQISSLPAGSIPAGSIPAGSIALWSLPAGSIAIEGTPAGSIPAGSIALQGTPAGSIPAGSILVKDSPAGSIPAGSIPAGSIPAGSIFAEGTPAGSIPAGSIALSSTKVGQIPLSLVVGSSPAGSIPAGSIPAGSIGDVLTCGATCPDGLTLAEAAAQGLLRPTAQLHMLGAELLNRLTVGDVVEGLDPALTLLDLTRTELNAIQLWMIRTLLDQYGVTLAELEEAGLLDGFTLGELPASAFADIELYEIILQILIRSDYPWEQLSLDGMQDFAGVADNSVGYTATARVACPAGETATFDLDLGEFRYIGGTGRVRIEEGDPMLTEPVAAPGGILRWSTSDACDSTLNDVVVTFNALPGLRIGTATSDLTVTAGGEVQPLADQAPVLVVENGEPSVSSAVANVTRSGERAELPDRLIVGHLSGPNDVDTITVPMPEKKGSRVRVFLSHVAEGADYDLAVSTPPHPGGPLQSTPAGSIPAGSIPLEDDGRSVDGSTALQNETLQDVPAGSIPAGSISANRGSEDEVAQVIANGADGVVTIRVTGYLGSWSPDPYMVRVKVYDPIELECAPRTGISLPATVPDGFTVPAAEATTKSLFLVNTDRMYDVYGDLGVASMLTKLEDFAQREEVMGQVVPIENDQLVRTAYNEWDQRPCDVDAANNVVRAVNEVIVKFREASPELRHVVLLGTDELLPFARVPDLVTLSNEQDEVVDLSFTLAPDGKANALYAAAAFGYILTNDAYTSFTHVPWLDRQLHLPDITASRMIETPQDIIGQLEEYEAEGGTIDVDTATTFVTGYDFLTDGSLDIADNTEQVVTSTDPARKRRLISDGWGKTDLTNVLLGANTPTINSLNAHFSHNLLQPAGPTSGQPGAGFTRSDLFSASEIPAPSTDPTNGEFTSTLLGRLLFSMGCHGGLNVADTLAPSAPERVDWAQVNAEQRAAVFIANTGYGYGDTVANALSERLLTIFSRHLADPSTTLAEKLVLAKHEYFQTMGTYGVFDEKVLIEMSYYGLPFWRVGDVGPAPEAPPAPVVTDGKASLSIQPLAEEGVQRYDGPRGTYWATGPDREVAFSPYRPLQPLVTKSVTVPGQTATGVLLTGLETSDITVADFARALPTIDLSANEPEQAANDDIYPANLVRLSTSKPFGALDQELVVIAGQSRGAATGKGGVERLVSSLDVDVLYGGAAQRPNVVIREVAGEYTPGATGGTVEFLGRAGGFGSLDAAYVLYRVVTPGESHWSLKELTQDATGAWTGTAQITTSQANPVIEMLFQGVKDGHVFYSTNKGFFFNALIDDSVAPTVEVTSPAPNQVFRPGQRAVADYRCVDPNLVACVGDLPDGAVLETATPGPRVFEVIAIDRAGNRQAIRVPFSVADTEPDTTAPTVTITSPVDGASYTKGRTVVADYACADDADGTGVNLCLGTVDVGAAIDTSTAGSKSFTVLAVDNSGNQVTETVEYEVVPDGTAPTITIAAPAGPYKLNQLVTASYACADEAGGSGLASCVGTVENGQRIDTSSVGTKSFTVTARDHAGNVGTKTVQYRVEYVFSGFLSPVDAPPLVNKMAAGAAVPVKFRLTDVNGVQVTTTAAVAAGTTTAPNPSSQKVNCVTGATEDLVEQTVTAGSSSLRYDAVAQQFVYTWKTDKAWANSCRVFEIKFADGTIHKANFSLKK
jgi:Tol biopolymer transport system component